MLENTSCTCVPGSNVLNFVGSTEFSNHDWSAHRLLYCVRIDLGKVAFLSRLQVELAVAPPLSKIAKQSPLDSTLGRCGEDVQNCSQSAIGHCAQSYSGIPLSTPFLSSYLMLDRAESRIEALLSNNSDSSPYTNICLRIY